MPWESGTRRSGSVRGPKSWLPQPPEYGALAVDRQRGVEGSTLELYRELLSLRRELRLGLGSLTWYDTGSDDVLAFTTPAADGSTVLVLANLGSSPVPLPDGARVLVASSSEVSAERGVPIDTAVWADIGPAT